MDKHDANLSENAGFSSPRLLSSAAIEPIQRNHTAIMVVDSRDSNGLLHPRSSPFEPLSAARTSKADTYEPSMQTKTQDGGSLVGSVVDQVQMTIEQSNADENLPTIGTVQSTSKSERVGQASQEAAAGAANGAGTRSTTESRN